MLSCSRRILLPLIFVAASLAQAAQVKPPLIFHKGDRILFQGDSITDGGRWRNSTDPNHILGQDYAYIIAAKYGAAYPEQRLTFINRGVSGDRVSDMAARWKKDALDLKPEVVSILIGVNDIIRNFGKGKSVSIPDFEKTYDHLMAETLAANPKVKFILGEPFILPGPRNAGHWAKWESTIKKLQAVVFKLGTKYHVPVVRYQDVFDRAAKLDVPANYWIWDGVHPTYAGHQLMVEAWIRAYAAFYGTELGK